MAESGASILSPDTIAVIDFGGQYAHLIAAKLRGTGVHARLCPPDVLALELSGYKGIILSGSPDRSSEGEGDDYDHGIFDLDIPILGLCYGHQEIAKHYGGTVRHEGMEFGPAALRHTGDDPLLKGVASVETVWMSHGDTVVERPEGFEELGYTEGDPPGQNAAIGSLALKRYGLQFHPEVDDTPSGGRILLNFAQSICGCRRDWNMDEYGKRATEEIRRAVGDRNVLLLASGGVDSTVCAWLISRAVGPDRLYLLHVDTGLMRHDESRQVVAWFEGHDVSHHVIHRDASQEFLAALSQAVDPEVKRGIIGAAFVAVLEREVRRLDLSRFVMAQGTIYPDTIESGGSKRAAVIKTHHNRVPVVQEMIDSGRMIEPLRDLYKVEVRELGRMLDIPSEALDRHPFPGPGIGVRVLCHDGQPIIGPTQADVEQAAKRYGFHAVALPVRSVGVKGDLRSYEQPIAFFGHSKGFAQEAAIEAAVGVINQVAGINRAVLLWGNWDEIDPRPVRRNLTKSRVNVAREADRLVHEALVRYGVLNEIWQCPVVLVPVGLTDRGGDLVVLRPVLSKRAMTARPARLPRALMEELAPEMLCLKDVWGVALDVTAKPPGTIEWE
ncbi:MAG: glutamine-hydrolyzing GMP synthase [Deltaproteobacteria bacterium]|nr:glutamine-hydrolyzing GMP synthase [Deltaproteobacteria bacterium]